METGKNITNIKNIRLTLVRHLCTTLYLQNYENCKLAKILGSKRLSVYYRIKFKVGWI